MTPRLLPALLLLAACAAPALDPETRRVAEAAERRGDWLAATLHWSDLHRDTRGLEPRACAGLARSLQATGALEAAARVLQPARARFPEDAELHELAGRVARARGRGEEALAAWSRAVELEPGRQALLLEVGELALELGERGRVLDELQLERLPADLRPRARLLRARARRADDPLRLEEYRAAFAGGEGSPEDRLTAAAQVLEAGGEAREAERWLRLVVQERPQEARAHRLLSRAAWLQGDLVQAEEAARRCAELEPGAAEPSAWLARVLWDRQRPEEALALLERAGGLGPDPVLGAWIEETRAAWTAPAETGGAETDEADPDQDPDAEPGPEEGAPQPEAVEDPSPAVRSPSGSRP